MDTAVMIIGGGPAGAALAVELQRWGGGVLVITSPRPRRRFEGLSDRTVALLRRQGFEHAFQTLAAPGLRHANWNGVASRHNSEYLVERSAFDLALAEDLRQHGVPLVCDEVTSVVWQGDHWQIQTLGGTVSVPFLVEARGRAAPAGQTSVRGPATLAVGRFFRAEVAADRTAVIPFADGWAWLGQEQSGLIMVQFTVDAESLSGAGVEALNTLHDCLCTDVPGIAEWLPADAVADGPAFARSCDVYLRKDVAAAHLLRVGDAACGYDPLSGQGVFLALAGALSAAAVVRTCVNRPDDAALASRFYADRLTAAFVEKVMLGASFYQQEQRWSERPFWQRRACLGEAVSSLMPTVPSAVSREKRPVLSDGWIMEHDVLVTPHHPLGVWRVEDVPILDLLDHLTHEEGTISGYATAHALPLAQVEKAARWLHGVGAHAQ